MTSNGRQIPPVLSNQEVITARMTNGASAVINLLVFGGSWDCMSIHGGGTKVSLSISDGIDIIEIQALN